MAAPKESLDLCETESGTLQGDGGFGDVREGTNPEERWMSLLSKNKSGKTCKISRR